jgi:hypothetical protein
MRKLREMSLVDLVKKRCSQKGKVRKIREEVKAIIEI